MSLDSRDRRAAAVAGALLWLVVPPLPDGDVAALEDRRHLAGMGRQLSASPVDPPEWRVETDERRAAWLLDRRRPDVGERHFVWLRARRSPAVAECRAASLREETR